MKLSKMYAINKDGKDVIVGPKVSPSQLRYVGIDDQLITAYQRANEELNTITSHGDELATYIPSDVLAKEEQHFRDKKMQALAAIEHILQPKKTP